MTTTSKGSNLPFRADHVGSLLRPRPLVEARERHRRGEISDADLREVENQEIEAVISRQTAVGLTSITDGEYRRTAWQWDFLERLGGIERGFKSDADREGRSSKLAFVKGKIDFSDRTMVEHFRFLKDKCARATPKMTLPSPTMLISTMRDWRDVVDQNIYATLDELYPDLANAYARVIGDLSEAGCNYLDLDDCNLAYLCDSAHRDVIRARGDDPSKLLDDWVALINSSISKRPSGMTIATHICRGNRQSSWFAAGGYEPIADALFNKMDYDAYFLEYDSERAGGFEPLRFFPKNTTKKVVLGLVSTKNGERESKDVLKRRIDEAAKHVPLSQLCLSPQCGFASTEEGNALTEDDQWRKLSLVVEVAHEVWG